MKTSHRTHFAGTIVLALVIAALSAVIIPIRASLQARNDAEKDGVEQIMKLSLPAK